MVIIRDDFGVLKGSPPQLLLRGRRETNLLSVARFRLPWSKTNKESTSKSLAITGHTGRMRMTMTSRNEKNQAARQLFLTP